MVMDLRHDVDKDTWACGSFGHATLVDHVRSDILNLHAVEDVILQGGSIKRFAW